MRAAGHDGELAEGGSPRFQENRTRIHPDDLPDKVDFALFWAVARFRDAASVHWLIRPDSQHDETPAGT